MVKVIKIGEEEEEPEVAETELTQVPAPVEEPEVAENELTQVQSPIEEPAKSELDDYKIRQKFVKRVYYSIILLIYFTFCYYLALDIMLNYANEEYSLSLLIFYILILSILFPVAIMSLGFFTSGGILIGPMVAATYGLMSLISRFIVKVLGLDVDLIFPELVGHVGVVRDPNALNKYTSYPLSVEIEKAGLYGNSFWHGNKIASRSSEEEIPVGTSVKVIEAEYWSFGSLLRNSPVLKVVPFEEDTNSSLDDGTLDHEEEEPEVGENELDTEKVNEEQISEASESGSSWSNTVTEASLVLLGLFFLLTSIAFYAVFCFLISLIAFALAAGVRYSDSEAPTSSFLVISFKTVLTILCFVFMFWGFIESSVCDSTYCDGVEGVLSYFVASLISIVIASLLHLKTISSDDVLNADGQLAKKLKNFKVAMVALIILFSAIVGSLHLKYGNETFTPDFSLDCTDAKVGPNVDLSGADLSNFQLADCDLSNRNLEGANLRGAALTCSDFSNSNLQGAVFTNSNIRGANFDNANLNSAVFDELDTGSVRHTEHLDTGPSLMLSTRTISPQCITYQENIVLSFTDADLTNASFQGFGNSYSYNSHPFGLHSVSFENAVLSGADFSGSVFGDSTIFTGALFSNTKLFGVTMFNLELSGVDMSNSIISDFYAMDLYSCPESLPENFTCVEFDEYSSVHNSPLSIIVGPSTRFYSDNVYVSSYRLGEIFSDYSGINLSGLYFPNSEFYNAIMANANMSYSNVSNSRFSYNESIYDSLLSEYNRWCEDTSNSSFGYGDCNADRDSYMLEPMGIDKIEDLQYELAADLSGVDFTGAILSNSDMSYADLTNATLSQADLTGVIWYYTICPDGTNTEEFGSCSAS